MKKILIVSLGSIGKRHLRNSRSLVPTSDIAILRLHNTHDTAVPEGANRIFTDLKHALEFKPDAVIVASPASEHLSNAIDFLKVGSNLFIEKPLALNASEKVSELIKTSKNANTFSMVGYVLRFQPIIGYLKQVLTSGELGDIRTANIEVGQYLPDWRVGTDYREGASAQKKLGGGALLELSHELDYATWFFGLPQRLYCSSDKLSNLEIDVEDSACVVMEYDCKLRVVVQVDFLQRTPVMSLKVIGSKATLYADLINENARLVYENNQVKELSVPKMSTGNEMYLRQFDYFFSRSFKNYELKFNDHDKYSEHVSVVRGANVLNLVDSAKESSQSGSRLNFNGNRYE